MNDELNHYGTKYHSGRYEYGSGENPFQHDKKPFYREYKQLKDKNMSAGQIADYFDKKYYKGSGTFNSSMLRAYVTLGKEQIDKENLSTAYRLRNEKQMSTTAIAKQMGVPESTVRGWLEPSRQNKISKTRKLADTLKTAVEEHAKDGLYLDVGKGIETQLGVSKEQIKAALVILEEEGYEYHTYYIPNIGTKTNTTISVLAKEGTNYGELKKELDKVTPLTGIQPSVDKSYFEKIPDPISIDSKRIKIRYNEEGGLEKDGCIELKPGVKDLDLGENNYAQVRIAVDGDHYLKGMAVYGKPEDFPKGTDIIFNTNKHVGTDKMKVLKTMEKIKKNGVETDEIDWDKPFGATIKRVNYYEDKNGERIQSPINIVNEDENWETWSKNLASQFLSKQNRSLAKQQLQLAYDRREDQFEQIKALTNPTLRKQMMAEFAESCDSDAVTLKAAPIKGQATHVLLPMTSVKSGEIYAPNYNNGEEVVLIRYPHGGTFEIPRLKVNNNNAEGKRIIGHSTTAIGINAETAAQLSGADFDGDTAVVIPTKYAQIKTMKPLEVLKDFDPKEAYPAYEGMPRVGPKTGFHKGLEMGKVSNLITDMTLQGAPLSDIAKADKHSMVIIDAEKHNLDWRRSAIDNNIAYLKEKYQGGANKGASTLISQAKADVYVNDRREVTSPNDKTLTKAEKEAWLRGEKVYKDRLNNDYVGFDVDTRVSSMTEKEKAHYNSLSKEEKAAWKKEWAAKKKENLSEEQWQTVSDAKKHFKETGELPTDSNGLRFKVKTNQVKSTRMGEAKDAHKLSSGLPMEEIYADHANRLKALANRARSIARTSEGTVYSPSANKAYAEEVASLMKSLKVAQLNAPLERRAQALAKKIIDTKVAEDPDLKKDKDHYKKVQQRALSSARAQVGSKKTPITISPKEWEAIQAGALSKTKLEEIFKHVDNEELKKLATPRKSTASMSTAQINRAKRLLESGHTQAEIAEYYGVSVSTINKLVNT